MNLRRKNYSIQEMLFSLLLFVLLPILVIQGYIYYDRYRTRLAEELEANLELARAVSRTFNVFVRDILGDELAIGIAATSKSPLSHEDLMRLVKDSAGENPAVRNFAWISPQGCVLASLVTPTGTDVSNGPAFREIASGRDWALGSLMKSRSTGMPIFTISRAIRSDKGDLLGVVVASIVPERLVTVLAVERQKGASVSLVDANGMNVFRYPPADYTWEQRNWIKTLPEMKDALGGKEVVATVRSNLTGEDRLVGLAPVYSRGWAAAASRARAPVVAGIIREIFSSAALFLMVTLSAFGVALALSRRIAASITKLRDYALELGKGRVEKDFSVPRAPPEIQDLARAFTEMTQKVRSREKDLRESEGFLRAVIESTEEAIVVLDNQQNCFQANRAAGIITGVAHESLIGRSLAEFLDPAYDNRSAWLAFIRSGRFEGEVRIRGNESWRIVEAVGTANIVPGRHLFVARDITERKRAEEALRKSEERQAFLLKITDAMRKLADPLEIQAQACRILGEHLQADRAFYAEVESFEGVEYFSIERDYHKKDAPSLVGRYPVERLGRALSDQYRLGRMHVASDIEADPMLTPEERKANLALSIRGRVGVPVIKQNRWVGLFTIHQCAPREWAPEEVALVRDVAERTWGSVMRASAEKAALRAMERYERQVQLFEGVASTTPDFVYIFDTQGRYLYANRRLLEVWGMKLPEVIGKTCRELGYEQWHHDMHMREIAQVIETRSPIKGEVPFKAPLTGIFGIYEYIFTPVIGPEGSVELIAGTTRDITERKNAEAELRRSEQRYKALHSELEMRVLERTAELQRKNQELQEFAFVASHDLNEPLRKIQVFGSLLETKGADCLSAEQKDYVVRMTSAANRMQELLAALLNYSRVDAKGEPFEPTALDDVVRDALSDLEVAIRESQSQVSVGRLPVVQGDPSQLRQLFQNLIGNAVKYRRTGEANVIEISGEEFDGKVRVTVEDNGIGFEEKYLDKIFQPFQRLHGHNEYSGIGIGLAICKKIVERHGGTITARSTLGKGSTFMITLPAHVGP